MAIWALGEHKIPTEHPLEQIVSHTAMNVNHLSESVSLYRHSRTTAKKAAIQASLFYRLTRVFQRGAEGIFIDPAQLKRLKQTNNKIILMPTSNGTHLDLYLMFYINMAIFGQVGSIFHQVPTNDWFKDLTAMIFVSKGKAALT